LNCIIIKFNGGSSPLKLNRIDMENSLDFIFGDVKKDLEDIYNNVFEDYIEDTLFSNYRNLTREEIQEMSIEQKRMLMGWN